MLRQQKWKKRIAQNSGQETGIVNKKTKKERGLVVLVNRSIGFAQNVLFRTTISGISANDAGKER